MKRGIIFLPLFLSILFLLCGCGTSGTPADTDAPVSEAAPIVLAGEGAPKYTIVRSDLAGDTESSAAKLVRKYMQNCGVDVSITTDWDKNPVSEYEIVVGDTLRADSETELPFGAHDFGEKGYFIKAVGSRLYIVGGSPSATYAAAERFLTDFFGYSGDAEKFAPVSAVTVAGDYELIERQSYAVTSVSVGGNDLRNFRITWDSTLMPFQCMAAAEEMQSYFYTNCGIWMDIDQDQSGSGAAVILTAKPAKSGYMEFREQDGNLLIALDMLSGFERGWKRFTEAHFADARGDVRLDKNFLFETDLMGPVYYSEFGAKGNGKTNDIAALIAAHEYANQYNLPVRADEGATYYVSAASKGAIIKTDTDWTGASFLIDDSKVGLNDRTVAIFTVSPTKKSYSVSSQFTTVAKGQTKLDITLAEDSVIILKEGGTKRYIRYGSNENEGSDQQEIILVDKNGNVDPSTPVIWDYTGAITAKAIPMDKSTLTLKGGTFTTIPNRQTVSSRYYLRGILINRSNVVVEGLTHTIKDEKWECAPYRGILVIDECANVTVRNCIFTPHRDNDQGGTYDISPTQTANLLFENCSQTIDILNTNYWGIMGSNFCKNITLKNCEFSRFDSHQGVVNATIIGCTLGHQCLNAIGSGTLRVEDSTLYGSSFINLRYDYGSTWEGDVIIKNCTWVPNKGNRITGAHALIGGSYNGFWDFGYECYMPKNITIEGLHIDDSKALASYSGIYLLDNFIPECTGEAYEAKIAAEGYPYHVTETITISGFTSASGKKWILSPNTYMFRNVKVVDSSAVR